MASNSTGRSAKLSRDQLRQLLREGRLTSIDASKTRLAFVTVNMAGSKRLEFAGAAKINAGRFPASNEEERLAVDVRAAAEGLGLADRIRQSNVVVIEDQWLGKTTSRGGYAVQCFCMALCAEIGVPVVLCHSNSIASKRALLGEDVSGKGKKMYSLRKKRAVQVASEWISRHPASNQALLAWGEASKQDDIADALLNLLAYSIHALAGPLGDAGRPERAGRRELNRAYAQCSGTAKRTKLMTSRG